MEVLPFNRLLKSTKVFSEKAKVQSTRVVKINLIKYNRIK